MRAMVLESAGAELRLTTVADPEPAPGQVLIRVEACGVCRTDLHIIDGELKKPELPLIPGHEIDGRVVRTGAGVTGLVAGMRVGVPWRHLAKATRKVQSPGPESIGRSNGANLSLFSVAPA